MYKGVSGGGCCSGDAVIANAAMAEEEDTIVEVVQTELVEEGEDVQWLANLISATWFWYL